MTLLGYSIAAMAKICLEIGIITLLTYVVVRFMRGTRGAGVARGAMVLVVMFFVILLFTAQLVRLENVLWIMENLVQVSMIGLIVIFQPEIRRGLIMLGEGAWRFYNPKGLPVEKAITDAAFAISKTRDAGALIAIERETPIGSFIESGISLDAEVSSKLLQTIFAKNTALHDGAVIIRARRISAANCLLPLSENVEECRGMGTRHRAAIGLSEESDAIVIVVSEETSAVSVAMSGKITRGLDYKGLLSLLQEHCFMSIDEESRIIEGDA